MIRSVDTSFFETTLKESVKFNGKGLHTGTAVRCVLHPADPGHGLVFVRSDVRGMPKLKADISRVVRTDMSTTLGSTDGLIVSTVEHLLAACAGLHLSNALIEIDGPETPIMDGSAAEFAAGILDSGLITQKTHQKYLRLRRPMVVESGDKWIKGEPADHLSLETHIHFDHPLIQTQVFKYASSLQFLTDVAAARTFGFLHEVEALYARGLARGGSLENVVVLDQEQVLNPGGLRFVDEFVRHKTLDALGDFCLLGMGLLAKITLSRSGHELHAGFLRKVLERPENYEILSADQLGVSESAARPSSAANPLGALLPGTVVTSSGN